MSKLGDVGDKLPLHPFALKQIDLRTSWASSNAAPYIYNPYPDYNSEFWRSKNQGKYVPCPGPEDIVSDAVIFRGKSEAFNDPPMGSYDVLQIDNTLCFERDTRLGLYAGMGGETSHNEHDLDWNEVNWGALQDFCYKKNSDRYGHHTQRSNDEDGAEVEGRATAKRKSRTAIVLRAYSGKKYTDNDRENIRALVTELSLRSGGEYQVFLLLQIKDGRPLTLESVRKDLPKEFWDMAVFWNDAQMSELYPKISSDLNKVHVSQWFSVQNFALDYPEFDYYWNWELDTRYTGHHYDLLERLAAFADKQPRRGLWERNERYYVPSVHGDYDTTFRASVEEISGSETVWGAPHVEGISPVGPKPPVNDPKDDNYSWGVGEEADYISLGPMFNPINASWVDGDKIWGYSENTPRRATIGTQSRCSRKLLNMMHEETVKGNHIGSEMTPQSIALLHGLKAVFAPIPVFFDRAWAGESLNKWFNPGPKGESGSTLLTPYGWGLEGRFEGSTWYYRTSLPMRLYNNFLGWEDSGIGGPEVCFLSSGAIG